MNSFKLSELIKIHNGTKYNHLNQGSIPVYGTGGVMCYVDSFLYDGEAVLLPRKGTLDNILFTEGKIWTVDTMYYATTNQLVLPYYLYCYLSLLDLKYLDSGSALPSMTKSAYNGIEVQLPELKIQASVVDVIKSIDEKIQLNNKINAELEGMAKLIYDYWFVQFDFPSDSPQNKGKPYKSSGGKMVYNRELKREIPDGWGSDYIENLLAKETRTKKLPRTEYQNEGSIPVIDQSTDYICGYTNDEDTMIITEVPRIVFGDHTRILKLVNFDFARGADGTQVLLSNNKRVPQHFFYHSLLKIDLSNYGYARHFKFLKQTRTIIPNQDVVTLFEDKMISFYDQIKHNIFETNKLTELRDWLLPMLMN